MKIIRTYKVEDGHGAEGFTTCEHCGRKVKNVALMSDGSVYGQACGIAVRKDAIVADIADLRRNWTGETSAYWTALNKLVASYRPDLSGQALQRQALSYNAEVVAED